MNELLKALAESDRELEAPVAVETRLRAAFRKKHARPKWPYFALAAVAAGIVLYLNVRSSPIPREPIRIADSVSRTPVLSALVEKPATRRVIHRRQPPKEFVTEFFSLIEDPLPFDRGELLRVRVPAAAMRSVGLPVNEDRLSDTVQADILVGEEGLARAIRFVKSVN